MTTTGFIILVLLFLLGIWIYVELAKLPGKKAKERGHPQAEAIDVLSWIGLLFGAVPWVVALVWAYMKPLAAGFHPAAAAVHEDRIPTDKPAGDVGSGGPPAGT